MDYSNNVSAGNPLARYA
jgi:uncharacterized membrane protein